MRSLRARLEEKRAPGTRFSSRLGLHRFATLRSMPACSLAEEPSHEKAARTLLRSLIEARGFNLQDLDARLHFRRGYVSRLLHGRTRLTYGQIIEILELIAVDPSLFFSTLHPYSRPPASEPLTFEDLRAILGKILPADQLGTLEEHRSRPLPPEDDIETRIEAAIDAVARERHLRERP